jgi:hypothetical protein
VAEKVSKTGFLENRKRRRWGRGLDCGCWRWWWWWVVRARRGTEEEDADVVYAATSRGRRGW